MNILISNDDGIFADGIIELAKEIKKIGNVYLVAPDSQRSATGHAITLHDPIMLNDEFIDEDIKAVSISGTPADCVKLGLEAIFGDVEFDLVLSGINNGPNLGQDVLYSGTVSAAIEGLIQGKRSIALSLNKFGADVKRYKNAAMYIVDIINKLKDNEDIMDDCILNINIPDGEIKGVKITTLGERKYENVFEERKSPRGQSYYWLGGTVREITQSEDSDIYAVENGYISITPIQINLTDYDKISRLNKVIG